MIMLLELDVCELLRSGAAPSGNCGPVGFLFGY